VAQGEGLEFKPPCHKKKKKKKTKALGHTGYLELTKLMSNEFLVTLDSLAFDGMVNGKGRMIK
jgi:hypothetical protein